MGASPSSLDAKEPEAGAGTPSAPRAYRGRRYRTDPTTARDPPLFVPGRRPPERRTRVQEAHPYMLVPSSEASMQIDQDNKVEFAAAYGSETPAAEGRHPFARPQHYDRRGRFHKDRAREAGFSIRATFMRDEELLAKSARDWWFAGLADARKTGNLILVMTYAIVKDSFAFLKYVILDQAVLVYMLALAIIGIYVCGEWDQLFKMLLSSGIGKILQIIMGFMLMIANEIQGTLGWMLQELSAIFGLFNQVIQAIQSIVNGLESGLNSLSSATSDAFSFFGVNGPSVPIPQSTLPPLVTGDLASALAAFGSAASIQMNPIWNANIAVLGQTDVFLGDIIDIGEDADKLIAAVLRVFPYLTDWNTGCTAWDNLGAIPLFLLRMFISPHVIVFLDQLTLAKARLIWFLIALLLALCLFLLIGTVQFDAHIYDVALLRVIALPESALRMPAEWGPSRLRNGRVGLEHPYRRFLHRMEARSVNVQAFFERRNWILAGTLALLLLVGLQPMHLGDTTYQFVRAMISWLAWPDGHFPKDTFPCVVVCVGWGLMTAFIVYVSALLFIAYAQLVGNIVLVVFYFLVMIYQFFFRPFVFPLLVRPLMLIATEVEFFMFRLLCMPFTLAQHFEADGCASGDFDANGHVLPPRRERGELRTGRPER